MLEVTGAGYEAAERVRRKPHMDDRELAFLAAVDIVEEFPPLDTYALAIRLPFVRGHRQKMRIIEEWIKEGLIEKLGFIVKSTPSTRPP